MAINGIKKSHYISSDHTYVPLVLSTLCFTNFEHNLNALTNCEAYAFSELSYSLCSNGEAGVLKLIPLENLIKQNL